jgi:predicted MFS family arabinose efflux permease
VRYGVVAGAGLAALAVAMGIGRFAFTPILPMMQQDAGVSVAAGGWLASANYVGYLAGALTATRVGLPAPVAIRGALVTTGLATLAMGVTGSFALWLALRALAGVASAWVLIRVSAWGLERLAPAGRPALNGTVFAGVGVGIALAGAACLALMRLQAASPVAWTVLGGAALILTAVIWPVFTDGNGRTARGGSPASRGRARHPDARRLVLCYGAYGFGYIIPATFIPVMARREIADPAVFGWAWPIFGIAAAVSTVVAVHGTANGGNRRVWVVAQAVMAIGVALPAVWSGMVPIVLAACAVGGTFVVITLVGMQEARRLLGPADAPPLMAAMTAAFGAGQILGPLCVSAVTTAGSGFTPALLLATAALAVSAWALTRAGSAATRAVPTRA